MVLTVTLNPLLERRWSFKTINLKHNNRSSSEYLTAGGKGINVSRQLNRLNVNNLAFTFIGGAEGKIFRSLLDNEKINYSLVQTKANTRQAILVIEGENNSLTTFFGPDSQISVKEAEEFKNKLEKMICNCSTVVFSGSAPSDAASDIFSHGIDLANKYDKISILDTYGSHLSECIDRKPTAIHNNFQEVRDSLGFQLSEEKSVIEYLHYLYSKGIKLVFLTDGPSTAYMSKFDFIFKLTPPEIASFDPAGSGDALVAGIVDGLEKNLPFEEFAVNAFRLAVLNAGSYETCNSGIKDINNFSENLQIVPVGKKMKFIDDSPNYQ